MYPLIFDNTSSQRELLTSWTTWIHQASTLNRFKLHLHWFCYKDESFRWFLSNWLWWPSQPASEATSMIESVHRLNDVHDPWHARPYSFEFGLIQVHYIIRYSTVHPQYTPTSVCNTESVGPTLSVLHTDVRLLMNVSYNNMASHL